MEPRVLGFLLLPCILGKLFPLYNLVNQFLNSIQEFFVSFQILSFLEVVKLSISRTFAATRPPPLASVVVASATGSDSTAAVMLESCVIVIRSNKWYQSPETAITFRCSRRHWQPTEPLGIPDLRELLSSVNMA
ncbi:hypothetical protein M9H77_07210 [Catharanthus roseus]|uniref:Uncharacterized protein n=1 Tax=Catharanthus roseus TaxID=4058 RepID=A0ACC0BUG8_CATRO|nr:hypothetical protein M9H77_07210 [Catharanthus roseus]